MPGFRIGNIGDGSTSELKPFYTYTWSLEKFGPLSIVIPSITRTPVIYLRECTLPTFTVDKEEIDGASLVYKVGSMVNWDDIRFTFYDIPYFELITFAEYIKVWRRKVWNPETGIGMADDYKDTSVIRVYNADDSVEYNWQLFNSWPQTIREGELSYSTSDVKIVEVTLSYDWAETKAVQ